MRYETGTFNPELDILLLTIIHKLEEIQTIAKEMKELLKK